jgi:hypothetical protein
VSSSLPSPASPPAPPAAGPSLPPTPLPALHRSSALRGDSAPIEPSLRRSRANPYPDLGVPSTPPPPGPGAPMGKGDAVAGPAAEGKSQPACVNSSNPYHECSDYCLRKIAEAARQRLDGELPGLVEPPARAAHRPPGLHQRAQPVPQLLRVLLQAHRRRQIRWCDRPLPRS